MFVRLETRTHPLAKPYYRVEPIQPGIWERRDAHFVQFVLSGVLLMGMTAVAWTQDIGTQADTYLTAWANQGRFSGAVLIAKGDKVLLRKGYGECQP